MKMNMEQMNYFFTEWLIIEKKFTEEQYVSCTDEQIVELKKEWLTSMKNANIIKI